MAKKERDKLLMTVLLVVLITSVANSAVIFSGYCSAGNAYIEGIADMQKTGNEGDGMAPETAGAVVAGQEDYFRGSADAPVTIMEYSDFQCPFCSRFYSDTLPLIETNYIDTGKAKLIYRDFPLSFHANAQKAAEAAECAGEQGKFWEMHDKLYENQQSLSDSSFKTWAAEIGLDSATFDDCLDSGKYASEVAKDAQDGQAEGISGTPSFLVNGQKIVGAQPYAVFEQAIEAALAS